MQAKFKKYTLMFKIKSILGFGQLSPEVLDRF